MYLNIKGECIQDTPRTTVKTEFPANIEQTLHYLRWQGYTETSHY